MLMVLLSCATVLSENMDVCDFLFSFPLDSSKEEAEVQLEKFGIKAVSKEGDEGQERFHSGYDQGLVFWDYPVNLEFVYNRDQLSCIVVHFWYEDHQSVFNHYTPNKDNAALAIQDAYLFYERIINMLCDMDKQLVMGCFNSITRDSAMRFNYPLKNDALDLDFLFRSLEIDHQYMITTVVDEVELVITSKTAWVDEGYDTYCELTMIIHKDKPDDAIRGVFSGADGDYIADENAQLLFASRP